MARLVLISKGEWSKTQQGVWRFDEDRTVMSHSILVRRNEEYGSLELKVRGLFNLRRQTPLVVTFHLPQWMVEQDGETSPPQIIRTNADIVMLMSVHEWNTEPKLCIVIGPQEVAKYHYICRNPFSIGRLSFLGEGVTEEQHLARINEIMSHGRMTWCEEVVNEFGDPEKLMLMHRFFMEVERARNSLDLNLGSVPEMSDHTVPNADHHPIGTNLVPDTDHPNGIGGFGMVEYDAGISPVSVLRNTYAPSPYGGVRVGNVPYDETRFWEMRQGYYETLMASSYAVELARIYGVPGSKFTGYLPTDLNIVPSGDQEIPQYQFPFEVSSTASSTEINTGRQVRAQINNSALGTGCVDGHVMPEIGMYSLRV
ncbi:hypothetical protein Bca4012_057905 [Brassica carinata]